MAGENGNRLFEKRDIIQILILAAIALAIGVYLIATTVLISKDGVFYIERAQQFASDPIKIIKAHPPGYPFLIMAAHKAISSFTHQHSNQAWIYSAQIVTLLCRLLSLIVLYFIGKLLIGRKKAFWSILILIILPNSAQYCGEVLRFWPYMLFLSTGFFFLLFGAKYKNWWAFGPVGLSCGLGYLVRPESIQLLLYGFIWLTICMFRSKLWGVSRLKIAMATALLFIGFVIPAAPYMNSTGEFVPQKAGSFIKSIFSMNSFDNTKLPETGPYALSDNYNTAKITSKNTLKAFGKILETTGENLMWFFMLPLLIGLRYRLGGNGEFEEQFLVTTLIFVNVIIIVVRYCNFSAHISSRWTFPLVTFTVFYVSTGLELLGGWLSTMSSQSGGRKQKSVQFYFYVLLVVGVAICLPKLLRPLGFYKAGYRAASTWLKENTSSADTIAVPDRRIAFYADRQACEMEQSTNTISGGQLTSGTWHHLAGTFDGENQKLYINGEFAASKKVMFKTLGEIKKDLVIGKHTSGSSSYYEGLIDDVMLYSRALSADEIKSLYNNEAGAIESSKLAGRHLLEGDAVGMDDKVNSAMSFKGPSDYINISDFGPRLNSDAITVSIWVQTELSKQKRWVIGSRTQFRIGVNKSQAYFWITEKSPGCKIPSMASYAVEIIKNSDGESDPEFSKEVEEQYSVVVSNKKRERRLVIYKVL